MGIMYGCMCFLYSYVHWCARPPALIHLPSQFLSLTFVLCFQSDRLHKVLEYVNEVHGLCGVLGLDFGKTVSEVHPSLHDTGSGNSTNISNNTLDGLAQTILKLKLEKKGRVQKVTVTTYKTSSGFVPVLCKQTLAFELQLKDIVASLFELWSLMDSPDEETSRFERVTCILGSSEQEVTDAGVLSQEVIEQV